MVIENLRQSPDVTWSEWIMPITWAGLLSPALMGVLSLWQETNTSFWGWGMGGSPYWPMKPYIYSTKSETAERRCSQTCNCVQVICNYCPQRCIPQGSMQYLLSVCKNHAIKMPINWTNQKKPKKRNKLKETSVWFTKYIRPLLISSYQLSQPSTKQYKSVEILSTATIPRVRGTAS